MKTRELTELVASLTSGEQEAVRAFIEYLHSAKTASAQPPFLAAIDKFVAEHPELLRNLAK